MMSRVRPRRVGVACGFGVVVGVALVCGSGRAAASGTVWSAQAAPVPSGVVNTQDPELSRVACQSGGVCFAVGTDQTGPELDVSGANESGWQSIAVTMPAGIGQITWVGAACPVSGDCVAVGFGDDGSGNPQGVILTGSGSTWTATEAPLASGSSAVGTYPQGVACMASSCEVISQEDYSTAVDAITGSGTSWTATQLPIPTGLPASAGGTSYQVEGVACSTAACAVAESYQYYFNNEPGDISWVGFEVGGSGTAWSAKKLHAPSGETEDGGGWRDSAIGCAAAGKCVIAGVVGTYTVTSEFLASGTAGATAWTTIAAPEPSDWTGQGPSLDGVACNSNKVCSVAGQYQVSGIPTGEFLASSGGVNSTSDWVATGDLAATPGPIACAGSTGCASAGGALFFGSGTTWTSQAYPLTSGIYTDESAGGVACWKSNHCLVAGFEYGTNKADDFITKPLFWKIS